MTPFTLSLRNNLFKFVALLFICLAAACTKNPSDIPDPVITEPPVSQNYKVYVGAQDNNLYAFNGTDGALIWKYESGGNFSYSTPALSNGIIYSTNTDGNLYAIEQAAGTLKWKFASGSSVISSPAISNGIVYFGSDDHYVYAVDALSGSLKWRFLTAQIVDTSPSVLNGTVYIGSADGYLYALDGLTGTLKWKYNTGDVIVESDPIISNGIVFIGNRSGDLNAIDATTGDLKWKNNIDGISLEMARFTVNDGVIYFASWYNVPSFNTKGNLYAVKENDGSLIWTGLKNQGFSSGPTYAEGKLFINSDDGNIYAVNALNGEEIWKKEIYANGAVPAIKNGKVFAGGGGSRAYHVLDVNSGDEKWKYSLPNSLTTSKPLIVTDGSNQ